MDTVISKVGGYRTGQNFLFPPPKLIKKIFKRRDRVYVMPRTNVPFNPVLSTLQGKMIAGWMWG
jgi:hypothetical protein